MFSQESHLSSRTAKM